MPPVRSFSWNTPGVPLACAALGLVISAGLTVASTRRGGIAVNGQVGAELPPGGVRSCPAASITAGARFEFGFYRTADGAFSWVGALDARTRASMPTDELLSF
jgi:hypothetical protein